ncbi:hypothetical protein [Gramella sp. AN32]|uniref:Secreted protein n=1 Tax=Christiangramia antarctica TaxID=2058158 RepID=A0ABW5X2A3_9FLAO|nr:hypothetical protein [Gramella sp. AN32]MCM4157726.1 hypothetical protein [Gramella sp. AN32]
MRRFSIVAGSLLLSATAFTSCRETEKPQEKEVIVREVEVEKEPEVEERKGILERTAQEVDKEVNKEIDKKIDEIGDDN